MPPKAATATATRRKPPSFKPPRPVDSTAQTASTAKRAPAQAKPPSRSLPAATIISSDEEQEEDEFDLPSDLDELMEDAPQEDTRSKANAILQSSPPIPAHLLSRLVHEHFEHGKTQMQKGAMDLLSSYMSIFVREAVLRAKEERANAAKRGERTEGFLQVDDLETITPQLVLDF